MTTTADAATAGAAAPGPASEPKHGNATSGAAGNAASGAADIDLAEVQRFAGKVAADQATAAAGALAWVGDKLGIWAALAASGPATSQELAEATGLVERYLREWLATQHAAGYLRHDADSGRFHLPPEWAAVLADPDSPAAGAGAFESLMAFYAAADRVAQGFRAGGGIPWGDHDPRLYSGVARFFRPLYQNSLVAEWLPALDGMVDRLRRGARVLDVGCGHGSSTLIMAREFPNSTFHGVDPHPGSVEAARAAAEKAGVADRVTFEVSAATGSLGSGYDLACFFDSFHHVGDAVAAAATVRGALVDDGALMLVEPRARDRVADNTDTVSLIFYAASTLVCLPDALSQSRGHDHDHGDALGGMAGPRRLAEVLTAAGFTTVRVATETHVNLIVEARP